MVKEEIRVNVMNQPYGGFPWLTLPPVLFETFPNAHNGYGGFEDLESATVDDAADFFDRYYAPGNAVLCLGGDLDVDKAMELVRTHFGDVPRRTVPERPDFDEPAPTSERREEQVDAAGPRTGRRPRLAGPRPGRPRRLPAVRRAHVRALHR